MTQALLETKHGFLTMKNKPSVSELRDYYQTKYYQNETGNYLKKYSDLEKVVLQKKLEVRRHILKNLLPSSGFSNLTMLEIGAGEGFALKFFSDMGWNVKGIDFSDFGCASHNPDMLCHLEVGDIFEILANKIVEKECFDVVWMDNVLEHALNPEDLLEKCKLVAKPGSILIVEVPNDFSVIQKYLIKSGRIPSEYWVSMPDHISYFSRDSLKNLCASTGWKECMALADFPIDIALLNIETNYIADKSKGKSCHNWRVEVDFLIHQSDTEKVVRFYQSLLDIGLGRCILGFYKFM